MSDIFLTVLIWKYERERVRSGSRSLHGRLGVWILNDLRKWLNVGERGYAMHNICNKSYLNSNPIWYKVELLWRYRCRWSIEIYCRGNERAVAKARRTALGWTKPTDPKKIKFWLNLQAFFSSNEIFLTNYNIFCIICNSSLCTLHFGTYFRS